MQYDTENPSCNVVYWQIQRLYGRYLRAESFRKALVYQKKYLLLLIGGFRDCEEETLAMIARMGAEPSPGDLTHRQLCPLSRFRSAARVIIAISRSASVYHISYSVLIYNVMCGRSLRRASDLLIIQQVMGPSLCWVPLHSSIVIYTYVLLSSSSII